MLALYNFFRKKMAILIHVTVIYAKKYDHSFGFQENYHLVAQKMAEIAKNIYKDDPC
jgi:hypothetical protein